MRAFVLVPMFLAIAVAIGFAVCRIAGIEAHGKELVAAGLTCVIAGQLAAIPLVLTRGADQAGVAQAALVGTVIHLFVSIAVAAVVVMGHVGLGAAFIYWLLGLYWIALIALVVAFTKAVRSAPMTQRINQASVKQGQ